MKLTLAFALRAVTTLQAVSAAPAIEKRTSEVYQFPPEDFDKREGREVYMFPPDLDNRARGRRVLYSPPGD
ncbi:hypothetical protein EVJ58_g932 [Rhodofomes roseus]|uniref:Uncharacterized protein n=1 Tax=Rhodofomes roseus TaxID=34475 RepID=A0A4Y9Z270_9APHY|nr:hypothetical protein EVJ58_g932 [Rhodofomes roseus]